MLKSQTREKNMHGPNLTSPIEERPGGLLTLGLGPVGGEEAGQIWAWRKKWPRALAAVNGSRGPIWTWRWSCPRVLARRSRGMAHQLYAEEAADGGARGDRLRPGPAGLGRGRR